MTEAEIKSNSEALRDETATNGISATRLGVILVAMAEDLISKYATPTGGIPSTDLATSVQTLLTKAGTALQASDITGKADSATTVYSLWGNSGPADNTTYILGEQTSLVLSTNSGTYSECPNGTLIFFSCPSDAATSITYKDNTQWTGEDAPEVFEGCSYCIAIINGAYSLTQITKQTLA